MKNKIKLLTVLAIFLSLSVSGFQTSAQGFDPPECAGSSCMAFDSNGVIKCWVCCDGAKPTPQCSRVGGCTCRE